jgi:hypothetical protein
MKFRKRPVVIDAIQWTGQDSYAAIRDFLGPDFICWHTCHDTISIRTLEGTMVARVNDWIIRGVQGEHYPCKPDIFEATYEPVE